MSKRVRIGVAPVHLTAWEGSWIDGGCLYWSFWSGPLIHVIAMGPPRAHEGIELTKRALTSGAILPMCKKPAH